LTPAFSVLRLHCRSLREAGGNIVNVASASGLGGDRQLTAYNAAKGATVNFTRGLAFDLGPFGIRVNEILGFLSGVVFL
jgi:meso-butanediol dehydrogenase/(S,S)-butanediol dehydrogenase/diacetyl reductase